MYVYSCVCVCRIAREEEAGHGSDIDSFVTQIMTEETLEKQHTDEEISSELRPPKYMDSVFISPIESRHPDADVSVVARPQIGVSGMESADEGDEDGGDDGYDWDRMEDRSFEQDSLTFSDADSSAADLSSSVASTLGSTTSSRFVCSNRMIDLDLLASMIDTDNISPYHIH
jgi:hypothetical protein